MHLSHSYIELIVPAVFAFIILGLALSMARRKKDNKKKIEFEKIEAKIALVRMALKSKVKKRVIATRSNSLKIAEGDLLDKALCEISELNFECGLDFDQYFESITNLNSYILTLTKTLPDQDDADIVIIRFMLELSDLSSQLNEKIKLYNKKNPKRAIQLNQKLEFKKLAEIANVFKEKEIAS